MNSSVQSIPVFNLLISFVPVAIVLAIMIAWSQKVWQAIYALGRMVLQLVLIGYLLVFIFETRYSGVVLIVLTVMLLAAGWISLNPVAARRRVLLLPVLVSLFVGCGLTLAVLTQGVLRLEPWFLPQYMIPLAGMTLANAMTSVSLSAERYETEIVRGAEPGEARHIAMTTGMIPVVNALFAVGLVALPGMMTGQILSGVSPLIAVRYQIMVMCMMFGGAGISVACFLWYAARVHWEEVPD
ncbi:MAG: ABC transporter permease [Gammaproteobacteria bacterium]|jgi:putative ABC transport system permease protein|nr:ABC transporter permease [Gammaproteobacteria bacterium]MBT4494533.1 ABC transporter permease [Gammaproteobacteria bacterium]MBT7371743.1 ABC transporter permease [Gammaproteobacteria bacterium]